MKKLLACLLVVILAFGMTVVSVSAATASPEAEGIVSAIQATDKNNQPASFKLDQIDGKVTPTFQTELKNLQTQTKDNTLKVVGQYDATIVGNPEFPITVTLNVLGISSNSKVYVIVEEISDVVLTSETAKAPKVINLSNVYNLANEKTEVKSFATTVQDGKITFTLQKPIKSLAIVTDKTTAANVEKENNVVSPQTGSSAVIAAMVAILSLGFTLVVYKKVKA